MLRRPVRGRQCRPAQAAGAVRHSRTGTARRLARPADMGQAV